MCILGAPNIISYKIYLCFIVGNLGHCIAMYDYEAKQNDELTIRQDDVVIILEKQDADWWLGELNGRTGIFPATYVQEN